VKSNALTFLTPVSLCPKAKDYCENRGMSKDMYKKLYHSKNFKAFVNTHLITDKFAHTENDDERLIIPFWSEKNELIGVQGRSLDPNNKVKYITIKLVAEDEELVYGMDTIDKSKVVYVLEGPIDSMFIENSVAFAGSSLGTIKGVTKRVLVWDNEPRNTAIKKLQQKAIRAGESIVVWSKLNEYKDVNEMIQNGIQVDADYLSRYTYTGLEAQLVFDKWKK